MWTEGEVLGLRDTLLKVTLVLVVRALTVFEPRVDPGTFSSSLESV